VAGKFPSLKPNQIIKLLHKLGFVERRQTGSHLIFKHPATKKVVIVPIHGNKDIKIGTLRSIIKQAGFKLQDLKKFLG